MKKVEYLGPTIDCLGRFDRVKKGDILEMLEYEYDCVAGDPKFKNLTPELSKEEKSIATKVKPCGTTQFDLRSIAWESPNLIKHLTARLSKQMLVKVINSINEIGGYIKSSDAQDNRERLVDRIVESSRAMEWDKLTIDIRQSLPASFEKREQERAKSSVEDDDEQKTTRQRNRKAVEV